MQNQRVRLATAVAGGAFAVHDPLTQAVGENLSPAVAVAPDGAALVAWRKYSATTVTVQAAARPAGGSAFTPLPDVGSRPKAPGIADVQAAMGGGGRATLTWTYYSGSSIGAQAASRGKSGAFGPVETVEEWFGGGPMATLVMDDEDNALFVWKNHTTVSYAQRPLGGAFGPTQAVANSYVWVSAVPVQAGFAADGSARVAWISDAGGRSSIHTSRIAPDGSNDGDQTIAAPTAPPGQSDGIGRIGHRRRRGRRRRRQLGSDLRRRLRAGGRPPPAHPHRDLRRHAAGDRSALQVSGLPVMGKPLTMHVTTSDALSGATAIWDFGDGTTEEGETVFKTYAEPGDYIVRVTVSDDAGNTATRTRVQRIDEHVPPL